MTSSPKPAAAAPTSARTHPVALFFQRLGDDITALIGDSNESAQAQLGQVALAKLKEYNPSGSISHSDLIDYVLSADALCPQSDLEAKFGEPPLTLYVGTHFDISALTWLDETTSIHQHEFCGAFHVLQGSSIHSRYRFVPWRAPEPKQRAIAGQLELIGLDVLRPGDTCEITRGDCFIHALFHLIRPSVTIVVRTTTDHPQRGVQYDYRWPGLALDPFQKHGPSIRKLQFLRMLQTLADGRHPTQLAHVLGEADLFLAYSLVSETLVGNADPQQARRLAQMCRGLPEAEREQLFKAAHYDLLSRSIISFRRKLHVPEHRFLLALLLNVFDRSELLRLVQAETRCSDPIEQVCQWIAEISGNTEHYRNLIEIDFNATALEMLASMFAGLGLSATLQSFTERHGQAAVDGQRDGLRALYCALRECALFHAVFADLAVDIDSAVKV